MRRSYLLICLAACSVLIAGAVFGAATKPATDKKDDFNSELQVSTYKPAKQRDPFSKYGAVPVAAAVKSGPIAPGTLSLEGILYEPSNPAAIVNGVLIQLNKAVAVPVTGGELTIKAVKITRSRVILDINGQKLELELAAERPAGTQ